MFSQSSCNKVVLDYITPLY